ncbi:PQQ-dependent sugar dehydrogenase [Pedobacter sp. ASV1-7]|uniref:PQQ-dependent sugar dehydrogenase n=1 Tax=Pedobacter sp. ASV1-7 TaxID=3145237 RepID=UPI0032E923B8
MASIKRIGAFAITGAGLMIGFGFGNGTDDAAKKNLLVNVAHRDAVLLADPATNYKNLCAGCHGEKIDMFVDRKWKFGNKKEDLIRSVTFGHANEGMPAFGESLTDKEINGLADYILNAIKNVDKYTKTATEPISDVFKTEEMTIKLETVAEGLDIPWGMAFLPAGEMLVTDRNGKFYKVKADKSLQLINGVPEVLAKGQGGLLDIALDPKFSVNKLIYLSYSKYKNVDGAVLATTAIMRAKLDGNTLSEQKDIFVAEPYSKTQHHYGSRMQFGKDGYLYFSVGDRGNEQGNPQEIKGNSLGKVHRIKSDGSIPADNPFVKNKRVSPSIYAYGHRNPQGMTIHPVTGKIWTNEHGPRGGDEVNIEEPGKNYGWPVITYGINYNGKPISNLTAKEGMVQPVHYWIPSIGPSGLAIVTGDKYKNWKGNLLSGSLRFKFLQRSVLKDNKVVKEEILFKNIGRVRDVRMAPDGFIYIAVESPGKIYKLVPQL